MDEKKYQVFVSSTFTDLKEARDKVIKSILSMYHIPIGMEMFSAADDEQWKIIMDIIDEVDYYILIIGSRYGSLSTDGISYTEKEYDYAISKGVPVMSFIREPDVATKPYEREQDSEKTMKLQAFIEKAKNGRMCDFWINVDDLAHKVSLALPKAFKRHQRIGWVRADKATSPELMQELATLSKEKRELQNKLEILKKSVVQRTPKIELEINDGKELNLEWKAVEFKEMDRPEEIDFDTIEAHLRPFVNREDVDKYNDSLPSEEKINEYNEHRAITLNADINGKPLSLTVTNIGKVKGNNIIVNIYFPKEIMILKNSDIEKFKNKSAPSLPRNPLQYAKRAYETKGIAMTTYANSLFSSLPSMMSGSLPSLYNSSTKSPYYTYLEDNELTVRINELMHTRQYLLDDEYTIIPTTDGKYTIKYSIICEEYAEIEMLTIPIIINKCT